MTTMPPTSPMPQNQTDIFVYSLYLLGGDRKDIDVEDIFVKCWELAPVKFRWRTREWCDYKKISKALQSCEAATHVGMILKINKYSRRLSEKGIAWVKDNEPDLVKTYREKKVTPNKGGGLDRIRRDFQKHPLWQQWVIGNCVNWDISNFASILSCYSGCTSDQWKSRILDLKNIAVAFSDKDLLGFVDWAENELRKLGYIK